MATVQSVYDFLDSIAPFHTQEPWDNSGFLVGDPNQEVRKIAVALDVTMDTLKQAREFGADLLVSHHPVIFHPVKQVVANSPVYYAAAHHISIISAHTCWDVAEGGVNDVLARLLGLTEIRPIVPNEDVICMLRAGELREPVPAGEFAEVVHSALDTVVRVTEPEKLIRTVAVCGGAGAGFLPELTGASVDAYVTGDAKHNDFLDFIDAGIVLFAAGHYETETVSMPVLKDLLAQEFPEITYRYLTSEPCAYIG